MTWVELWTSLERTTEAPGPGYVVRRVYPESALHLFIGVEQPGARWIAALHATPAAIAAVGEPPVTHGVQIRVRGPGPDGRSILELVLSDRAYRDVFAALAADVLGAVAGMRDDTGGIRVFMDRMVRWQRLLQRAGPDGLGLEAQVGLYGELWVLERQAIPNLGPSAVAFWSGPTRAVHDFQFGSAALEVKATTSTSAQSVRITNERQLDESGVESLILLHVSLAARSGHGETLPEAVAAVREAVAGDPVSAALFEDRLTEAGYLDVHAPRYAGVGYTLRGYRSYRVRDLFPRITEGNLPFGVSSVSYDLNLAACGPFTLSQPEFEALWERPDAS